nr:LysR substrate-binding domain-containing protein [Pectobacterium brasiliense]
MPLTYSPSGGTIDVPAEFTVNDYLHLRVGALADNFITELPAFFAAEYIKRGELIELLLGHPLPYSSLHLVYKKQQRALNKINDRI